MVLADGEILDMLTTMRKDNTGYDLKQLFIGAEGTLGVITEIALLCPPRPRSVNVTVFAVKNFGACCALLQRAKQDLGEILSEFEFFDINSVDVIKEQQPQAMDQIPLENTPFYVLVETSGSNGDHDKAKLFEFLDTVINEGLVEGGVQGDNQRQIDALRWLRDGIGTASLHKANKFRDGQNEGSIVFYDVSLPQRRMYDIVEQIRGTFKDDPDTTVLGFGHLGDGNLHVGVISPEMTNAREDKINPLLFGYTQQHNGSISAEHGIGQAKLDDICYSKKKNVINWMRKTKELWDPLGILNPGKVVLT